MKTNGSSDFKEDDLRKYEVDFFLNFKHFAETKKYLMHPGTFIRNILIIIIYIIFFIINIDSFMYNRLKYTKRIFITLFLNKYYLILFFFCFEFFIMNFIISLFVIFQIFLCI